MQIKINDLSYVYLKKTPNEVEALHHVSLEIPEGKITSIIGHTGSGKSTLIQTLNGLLIPSEGEVNVGEFKSPLRKIRTKTLKNSANLWQLSSNSLNINYLKRLWKKMSLLV